MTRLVSDSLDNIGWWQDWMFVFLIAFALAFYWLVDWIGSRQDRPIAASWAAAAETLGASFRAKRFGFSDMAITGTSPAGVDFKVWPVMTDKFGGTGTRYRLRFHDPALPKFQIVGKGEVTAKARMPRILTGDDRYDARLRIRSNDERAQIYLTPEVLEFAADLVDRFTEVRVEHSQILIQSKGLESDRYVILRTVTMLLEATRLLSPQLALAPRN